MTELDEAKYKLDIAMHLSATLQPIKVCGEQLVEALQVLRTSTDIEDQISAAIESLGRAIKTLRFVQGQLEIDGHTNSREDTSG